MTPQKPMRFFRAAFRDLAMFITVKYLPKSPKIFFNFTIFIFLPHYIVNLKIPPSTPVMGPFSGTRRHYWTLASLTPDKDGSIHSHKINQESFHHNWMQYEMIIKDKLLISITLHKDWAIYICDPMSKSLSLKMALRWPK